MLRMPKGGGRSSAPPPQCSQPDQGIEFETADLSRISDSLMESSGGAALLGFRNTAGTGIDADYGESPQLQLFSKGATAAAEIQNTG